jgi:hypothetical protein
MLQEHKLRLGLLQPLPQWKKHGAILLNEPLAPYQFVRQDPHYLVVGTTIALQANNVVLVLQDHLLVAVVFLPHHVYAWNVVPLKEIKELT